MQQKAEERLWVLLLPFHVVVVVAVDDAFSVVNDAVVVVVADAADAPVANESFADSDSRYFRGLYTMEIACYLDMQLGYNYCALIGSTALKGPNHSKKGI